MYKPAFNKVLVEIDDQDAQWGGNDADGNPMGKMYNKGKMIQYGTLKSTNDNPLDSTRHEDEYVEAHLKSIQGKDIMWNEGHEAGTTFEEDGKLYGLVYWWDIVGIKE